jgi:hypothetical protein
MKSLVGVLRHKIQRWVPPCRAVPPRLSLAAAKDETPQAIMAYLRVRLR